MSYIDSERKSFFKHAALKLSNMLEDRLFDAKTENDFIDWCEKTFENEQPYEIAGRTLYEFQERCLQDYRLKQKAFKPDKTLLSCNFAESLYSYIAGENKP